MKTLVQSLNRKWVVLSALCVLSLVHSIKAHAQTIHTWGDDRYGVVSDAPTGPFTTVALGSYHAVAIRLDGTLASWGFDYYGQVSGTPTSGTFIAIAAGGNHSVAIQSDGHLVAWGLGPGGQDSVTPEGTFQAVSAGYDYNVAIRTDGSLASWGSDIGGVVSNTPQTGTYRAVAAGGLHCVAIRNDGTLVSWGNNSFGQISRTPSGTYSAVAAGWGHTLAIGVDGKITAWGCDTSGQVSSTPTNKSFLFIAAGANHNVAIGVDGSLVSWGSDFNGQVSGTPRTDNNLRVAAGDFNSMVLCANQSPVANSQSVSIPQDTSYSFTLSASDPDGDQLTYSLGASPSHGTLSGGPLNLTYTPDPAYHGTDSFTFIATDPSGASNAAVVTINVVQTRFNVSDQVSVTRGTMVHPTSEYYYQDVKVTNTSSTTINGPISLVLKNLLNCILENRTGYTIDVTPISSPYITKSVSLAPGQSVTFSLTLRRSSSTNLPKYDTKVVAGPGVR